MSWGAEPTEMTRACDWCGEPFVTRSYMGRYCSTLCRKAVEQAVKRRRKQEMAPVQAPKPAAVIRTVEGDRCGRCGGSVVLDGYGPVCMMCSERWEGAA